MEDIIPFLVGFTGKIIDEIYDNKLNVSLIYLECLKSFNVCLFTLTGLNDFLFSLSTLLLSSFGAGIDINYWKSFIPISFFLSIISLSPIDNVPLFIFTICIILLLTHLEEKQFPEEYSFTKLVSRTLGLIFLTSIYFLPLLIKKYNILILTPNITYIRKLILIAIGGLAASLYFLIVSNQVL